MAENKAYGVIIPQDLFDELKRSCLENGLSEEEFIELAVNEYAEFLISSSNKKIITLR